MIRLFKISELLENIKITLSENFPAIDVNGEISDVNVNSKSGHIYFNLKEDKNVISCACWKNNALKLKGFIEEGNQVKVRGRVLSYPTNSKFYINVANIEKGGLGLANKNLLILEEDLSKEGLFDDIHKKAITKYPKSIGLITSSNGDVINDIKTTLQSTYYCKIYMFDVPVQGEDSVNKICEAIEYFNALTKKIPEFLIIARGGGSTEDLFHFNDEKLVRAIFKSKIPIVTAIGHEPDSSLADRVADKSVVTPTASVAFLANNLELRENLKVLEDRLSYFIRRNLDYLTRDLFSNIKLLQTPIVIIKNYQDKVNYLFERQQKILSFNLDNCKSAILVCSNKVQRFSLYLKNYITSYIGKIEYLFMMQKQNLSHNLDNYKSTVIVFSSQINNLELILKNSQQKLFYIDRMLNSLSFKETLKRGFSVVLQNDRIIKLTQDLKIHDSFEIEFFDGKKSVPRN